MSKQGVHRVLCINTPGKKVPCGVWYVKTIIHVFLLVLVYLYMSLQKEARATRQKIDMGRLTDISSDEK